MNGLKFLLNVINGAFLTLHPGSKESFLEFSLKVGQSSWSCGL